MSHSSDMDVGSLRAHHSLQQELVLLRLRSSEQFELLRTMLEAQSERLERLEQGSSSSAAPPAPVPVKALPTNFRMHPPQSVPVSKTAPAAQPSVKRPPPFKATAPVLPPQASPAPVGEEAQFVGQSLRHAESERDEALQRVREAEAEALAAEEHVGQLRRRAQHQQQRADALEAHAAFLKEQFQLLVNGRRVDEARVEQEVSVASQARCVELSLQLEATQQAARALAAGQAAAEARAIVAEARVAALEAATAEAQQAQERLERAEAESASLRATLQGVGELFMCPVRHGLCRSPVVASDGHTYDRRSLARWLRRQRTSPMTREPLLWQMFPNRVATAVLQLLREAGLGTTSSDEEEDSESPVAVDTSAAHWRRVELAELFRQAELRPRRPPATRIFDDDDEDEDEDAPMLDVFADGPPVIPEFPPGDEGPAVQEEEAITYVLDMWSDGAPVIREFVPATDTLPTQTERPPPPLARVQDEEEVPLLHLWDDGPPVFPGQGEPTRYWFDIGAFLPVLHHAMVHGR